MNELIIFFCIAGLILNIVILIKFFKLCNNVAYIKKKMSPYDKPHVELLNGDTEKIKATLTAMFIAKVQTVVADDFNYSTADKDAYIKDFAKDFDEAAKKLGVELDFTSHIEGLREKLQVLNSL